eukprot:4098571-Pyramimonas_sp.AAC.1
MPRWWLDGRAWDAGLLEAGDALRSLEGVLRSLCAGQGKGQYGFQLKRVAAQWLGDALAWILH